MTKRKFVSSTMQEELWRHAKKRCEFSPFKTGIKDEPQEILLLGRGLVMEETLDDPLLTSLFSKLRAGPVATIIQEDEMGREI